MSRLRSLIAAAFLPERCPFCDDTVPMGKTACMSCTELFPETITESYAKGGYPCAAPFLYTDMYS
ncbi:MAG: hypothetical protein IJ725_01910, partial [Ruminococcus sp.]|nr:hypothetical protein [Ruminococcus sp.]